MERFKKMADQIQDNLLQTANLHLDMKTMQAEVNGINKKIDELKEDFKDLTKFIRDNIRTNHKG